MRKNDFPFELFLWALERGASAGKFAFILENEILTVTIGPNNYRWNTCGNPVQSVDFDHIIKGALENHMVNLFKK